MRKSLFVALALLAFAAAAPIPTLISRRLQRRRAAAARPKVEALLDEMIGIVIERTGSQDDLVGSDALKIVDDTLRRREIILNLGEDHWYSLDFTVRLHGRDVGQMQLRISRNRKEQVSHVYWPDVIGRAASEPWLVERLERLEALVSHASHEQKLRRDRLRHEDDDEDGGFKTN